MKWEHITSRLLIICILFFLWACGTEPTGEGTAFFIYPDAEVIRYQGRIGQDSAAKIMYWSGSSIKVKFKGSQIAVVLKDETYNNYFNILIDGELTEILRPDTLKKTYVLAEGLSDELHTVEIFKRTEWRHGKTWFYGFEPEADAEFSPLPTKNKSIEFYGNSITAGYAVEDYSKADSPDSIYTNFYHSYAALTARHFDANYSAIVKSGIGITISWEPDIMPEIWDRLDPTDPLSSWDFSKNVPEVVVVNLLQNDSWLTLLPDFPEYKRRFPERAPSIEFVTARYQDFVRDLRGKYPAAHIICMMGNMDITKEGSPWPKHLKEVVEALKDSKMYTLIVPYKNTPGHPRIEEQEEIANALIRLIEMKVGW